MIFSSIRQQVISFVHVAPPARSRLLTLCSIAPTALLERLQTQTTQRAYHVLLACGPELERKENARPAART